MGKRKHLGRIENLLDKSPVVQYSSINRIVRSVKKNNYAKLLVNKLVSQGKIKKLAKGCYTKHDEISLCVFCFKPAYLGLQSALSFHGLWEQETIPVILTIKKARCGIRDSIGANVLIRRIDKKHFFGFAYGKDGDFYLPYSDIEKTAIDFVSFRQKIPIEALENIRARINSKKLKKYLKEYPESISKKVAHELARKLTPSSSCQ